MEKHAQVKQSGIPWIQEIPTDWGIRVLFQLTDHVKNKNKDLSEKNLLSLSYGKIKRKDINTPEGLLPESFDGYNIIEENDIVLRLTDLQNDHTSLRVGQSKERGIITSAYITLRPSHDINPHYLYYALHAYDLIKGFYGMGAGVRQGLNYDEVKTLKLPFPPMDIQDSIVKYLDKTATEIDEIIEEAKYCIEEYKKWKLSLIHKVVTKGLNSKVALKDCGLPSFSQVPVHWQVLSLKNILLLRNEKSGGVGELLSVYLDRGVISYSESDGQQVHKPSLDLSNYQIVHIGDFVMNNQQAWRGSVGVSRYEGIISPAYFVYQFTIECDSSYMNYVLRDICMVQQYEIASRGVGSIQRNIYAPWLLSSGIALPPVEEQRQIANYLNNICAQIDSIVREKQILIDDLETYKRSLIYEAVTGKRKVV